jgi:hypothetical protein
VPEQATVRNFARLARSDKVRADLRRRRDAPAPGYVTAQSINRSQ